LFAPDPLTDTLITLPPYGIPGLGGVIRENSSNVTLAMLPHVLTNANIEFIPNIYATLPLTTSFNAIVAGTLKTIKLIVNL
jgi:hypothetical protein